MTKLFQPLNTHHNLSLNNNLKLNQLTQTKYKMKIFF